MLKYSKNYLKTSGSLWNYHRDELTDGTTDANGPNKDIANSKSFKYKAGITGSIYNVARRIIDADGNEIDNPNYDGNKSGTNEVEIRVVLKYLDNFWSSLDIPLVNCEVPLALVWFSRCVITSLERRIQVEGQPVRDNSPTSASFAITDCKLYDPVELKS